MQNMMLDWNIVRTNIREGRYRNIGSGSGRRVFDLGNGYVIKVAKNKKGIAQNEVEYEIALDDKTNLFAKIPQVSDNFDMLIMEKAELVKHFHEVLDYFYVDSKKEFIQLDKINAVIVKYNLVPDDLLRTVNWGIVNNRPVIIDYGFTWKVKKKYY
jgi:hypothetical protein